jgi:CheY-like chemotaxis protein
MHNKKILVADDDKVVRAVLAKIAARHCMEVETVSDGKEAYRRLSGGESCDLVILDLLMPNLSGWDVLESMESNSAKSNVQVIVLTGADISAEEKQKLESKTAAVIDKESFNLERFEKLLKDVLE